METKHYIVDNMSEFSDQIEAVKKLQTYLDYIEGIFPVIEEVLGQEWEGEKIHIILKDSTGYDRPGGKHTISIKIHDGAIQKKNYPENLWGCLLHETLHAFMNPLIHGKIGGPNFLDGDCDNEPFVRCFQALVYLALKAKGELSNALCDEFLANLERGIKQEEARKLYNRYKTMFLENPLNFHKFLERLKSSDTALFKKSTFQQDFEEAEKTLKS